MQFSAHQDYSLLKEQNIAFTSENRKAHMKDEKTYIYLV